jgi:hypothetical protein
MISEALIINQPATITFVMVDSTYTEVPGLGITPIVRVSKAGGGFILGTGAVAEIGNGWYSYVLSALETNTVGPVSVRVTAAGCIQQNLEYVVEQRNVGAVAYPYMIVTPGGIAIPGTIVWITTDIAGALIIWSGVTDAFGVARDAFGNMPWLSSGGTYYFWRQKVGYTFTNPDTEVV